MVFFNSDPVGSPGSEFLPLCAVGTVWPSSRTNAPVSDLYDLYHGWASPVPGCDTNGYETTEPTINGGRFPFKLGDSLACKAWKLAATVCSTPPYSYNSDTNSTGDRSWNFQCRSGGFAAFDRVSASSFGEFCFVADQYICTGCPGACNAQCSYAGSNPVMTMRGCNGSEAIYNPDLAQIFQTPAPTPAPASLTYVGNYLGSNVCPAGYSKITTDAGCEAAGASLGYSYYGNFTYPAYPSGCFVEPSGARLNLDPIGAGYSAFRPLCQISGSNLTYDEYSQRVAALEAEVAQLRATVHSQAAELEFYRNRTRA